MTFAGHSSHSAKRVLIVLVVIAIVVVAFWATRGGLDDIKVTEAETAVVAE